jgi:hypothetical protein
MAKRRIALALIPLSTLIVLLVLIQFEEIIFGAFPGPTGKIGLLLIAVVLFAVDGWVVYLLSRRTQEDQEEQLYRRTGRRVEEWIDLVSRRGPSERDAMISWLAMQHGLSESDAAFILAERVRRDESPVSATGPSQRVVLFGCIAGMFLAIVVIGVTMILFSV